MKLLSSVAAVVVFAVPALLQQCTPPPPGELTSVRSGTWDDPGTWGGSRVPTQNDKVTISPGHTVNFPSARSYFVATTKNVIVYGTLQMRPASATVVHTLRFAGVNPGSFVGGGMDPVDSDVGLWVVGSGRLDIAGTPATGWLRAAGNINAGSTAVALESTPVGWQPGHEVAISPTESPAIGTASYTGFDEAALTSVGQTIGLSRATARAHPVVDGRWSAEVANLTRNVRIEGEPGRQSHVFIRSTAPSTIRYAALRHMGTTVLGRYAIHFHMAGDGSRGSLVEGTVVRDSGGHAFVSHLSNGVTFRDTVAYNVLMDAYWWDPSQNADCPDCGINPSHDVTYQHALAAKVLPPPGTQGYRMAGFELGAGDRNRCIDCTAVGVQGSLDASGFEWPEGSKSEWVFATGNRTHNNKVDGIFNWQNTSNSNLLAGFVSFHNQGLGVDHGAYKNVYHFEDCDVYGNRQGGFRLRAVSGAPAQVQISRCIIDSAGLSDSAIIDQDHFLPGDSYTTLISNSVLKGAQIGLKFSPFENNQPNQTDLVCNQIETSQDVVIEAGRPAGDRVRLQDCAGNAWEITQTGRRPIPRFL